MARSTKLTTEAVTRYGAQIADATFRPSRDVSGFRTGPQGMGHTLLTFPDIDAALAFYKDLLAHKYSADLGSSMENQQQGEQMQILVAAGLPESPSFPTRPLFAAGGLGAGLALGLLIGIWLEFSDKSIRTEKDAAAIMDLPLLISVPWLGADGAEAAANGNGRRRFWGRRRQRLVLPPPPAPAAVVGYAR